MRSVTGFTDERIYVTLFDGAFDVEAMDALDREVVGLMVNLYRQGLGLVGFEAQAEVGGVALRLQRSDALATVFADLCRRIALEESGYSARIEELEPWHPEESRRLFEAWTGYRPALGAGRLAA